MAWMQTNDESPVLQRRWRFKDFASGLRFVNQVGVLAEAHDHHPDVELRWGEVVLRLSTHDAEGAITDKDHALAEAIDALSAAGPSAEELAQES